MKHDVEKETSHNGNVRIGFTILMFNSHIFFQAFKQFSITISTSKIKPLIQTDLLSTKFSSQHHWSRPTSTHINSIYKCEALIISLAALYKCVQTHSATPLDPLAWVLEASSASLKPASSQSQANFKPASSTS